MEVFERTCARDYSIGDKWGRQLTLYEGEKYLTSPERDSGEVLVFTKYWVVVPLDIFCDGKSFNV